MTIRTKTELEQYLNNTFIPADKVPASNSNTKINASQHKTFMSDLLDSIDIGSGIDSVDITGNTITITKTDNTTETVDIPNSIVTISQNNTTGIVTFSFADGTTTTIHTMDSDEEFLLSTLSGFNQVSNEGKIVSIDSNGRFTLIDAPSGGGTPVTPPSTSNTLHYALSDSADVPSTGWIRVADRTSPYHVDSITVTPNQYLFFRLRDSSANVIAITSIINALGQELISTYDDVNNVRRVQNLNPRDLHTGDLEIS